MCEGVNLHVMIWRKNVFKNLSWIFSIIVYVSLVKEDLWNWIVIQSWVLLCTCLNNKTWIDQALRSCLFISYRNHNYHTWNKNVLLLLLPRVVGAWLNFLYQFVKVRHALPDFIKRKESYPTLKNAFIGFHIAQNW